MRQALDVLDSLSSPPRPKKTEAGVTDDRGVDAAKKRKVAFVGRTIDVERVLRWKKRSGIPLGDVDEQWRQVLPPELFQGPILGEKAGNPINVDEI